MAESHVVSGLVSKRSELAGLVAHHQQAIAGINADLKHLDAAIKLFAPDFHLAGIKTTQHRQYSHLFRNGECYRLTLDALRESGGIATIPAIVERIMAIKSLEADQLATVADGVKKSMYRAEKSKLIHRSGLNGRIVVWSLV